MIPSFILAFWLCLFMYITGTHEIYPSFIFYVTIIGVILVLAVDILHRRPMKPSLLYVLDYINFGVFLSLDYYIVKHPITIYETIFIWGLYAIPFLVYGKSRLL